ncbi:hypothetical protein GCM10025868_25050 [Angustibacter aerolatus]|uniref:Uncharacterized protein n=1 Tax=Angustibacter aerolatus TaxID=1162965 RepID=A0ABQ6JGD9_9ACTN|nr:hypothetical protein GCM10025868_25050 [Angustibacter aerolatus]
MVGEGPPVARVHGPSSALLLVVWGRRRAIDLVADGTLRAEGDAATARRLLSEQARPVAIGARVWDIRQIGADDSPALVVRAVHWTA